MLSVRLYNFLSVGYFVQKYNHFKELFLLFFAIFCLFFFSFFILEKDCLKSFFKCTQNIRPGKILFTFYFYFLINFILLLQFFFFPCQTFPAMKEDSSILRKISPKTMLFHVACSSNNFFLFFMLKSSKPSFLLTACFNV